MNKIVIFKYVEDTGHFLKGEGKSGGEAVCVTFVDKAPLFFMFYIWQLELRDPWNVAVSVFRVAVLNDVQLIAQETDCLPGYISKGISMACFYFARCLAGGLGVKQDQPRAKEFYSRVWSDC